jgi:hypothetical protein
LPAPCLPLACPSPFTHILACTPFHIPDVSSSYPKTHAGWDAHTPLHVRTCMHVNESTPLHARIHARSHALLYACPRPYIHVHTHTCTHTTHPAPTTTTTTTTRPSPPPLTPLQKEGKGKGFSDSVPAMWGCFSESPTVLRGKGKGFSICVPATCEGSN